MITKREIIVDLDEHGLLAVDDHRMDGRGDELPAILLAAELCKAEVMALSAAHNHAIPDDSIGDVDGSLPAISVVQRDSLKGVSLVAVHNDIHQEIDVIRSRATLPFLLDRHGLGRSGDGRRINEVGRAGFASAGVGVGDGALGIGLKGAIRMEVLLQIRVHNGVICLAVIEPRLVVQSGLARIHVEGYGVGDAIEQHTNI